MNSELIEEYFDPNVSDDRKLEIRKTLLERPDDDPERILFELGLNEQLREDVNDLQNRIERITKKNPAFNYLKIAASVVILLSIGIVVKYYTNKPKTLEIFQSYYQPYDGYTIVRGGDDLQIALLLYENGNYAEASLHLEKLLEPNPNNAKVKLLLASCYLSQNEPKKAQQILVQITNNNTLIESNKFWYLALSYLDQNKIEDCKIQLNSLIEGNLPHAPKAKKLLREPIF